MLTHLVSLLVNRDNMMSHLLFSFSVILLDYPEIVEIRDFLEGAAGTILFRKIYFQFPLLLPYN